MKQDAEEERLEQELERDLAKLDDESVATS